MQCCLHGWSFSRLGSNFQRTVLVPGSCICFAPRETGPDGEARCVRTCFSLLRNSPIPLPYSFLPDGSLGWSLSRSFLPSFLSVCSLSYVFLPFPSRSSIKRSSLFHSSTAPTPPPLCLSLARLCRNFALLDQLSLSPSPQLQRCTTITIGRTGTQVRPPVGHQVQ